jgi:hypothetical protein
MPRAVIEISEPIARLLTLHPGETADQVLSLAALTLLEGPRCPEHGTPLVTFCPRCRGQAQRRSGERTPAQQRATRAATRARRAAARARRERAGK